MNSPNETGTIRQFLIEMAKESEATPEITRDDLIADISAIQDELETLGISREKFNFEKLTDLQIAHLLDSIGEQLRQRKRFLGVS